MRLNPQCIQILVEMSAFVVACGVACYVAGRAWCKRNPIEIGGSDVANETGDERRMSVASSDAQLV